MEKSKKIRSIVAGCLAGVCLATAGLAIATNGFKTFGKNENAQIELPAENNGGAILDTESGQKSNMSLTAVKLASTDYEEYGVSAQAETAYTLTATITPADALNKAVNWSVAFKNASSTWATGKTVTDYVTVTPSSDGALTAVVENVAAFGEQIVVTVQSRENTDARATCTVEYLQRTTGYQFTLNNQTYSTEKGTIKTEIPNFQDLGVKPQASAKVIKSDVYTRENTDKATYWTISPSNAFKTAIENAGLDGSKLKTFTTDDMLYYFDGKWAELLGALTGANRNKLIQAISDFSGNAYEVRVFDEKDGTMLMSGFIKLDASKILTQKGVEGITIDETEIVF